MYGTAENKSKMSENIATFNESEMIEKKNAKNRHRQKRSSKVEWEQ